MAQPIREVRETTTQTGNVVETNQQVVEPARSTAHRQNVLARLIWLVASILLIILAFRFVLALLGANPSNGFANFIYSVSHPFVAPFFGLFSYNFKAGVARFEVYTLVAMAVYAIIAYILGRLVTLTQDSDRV